MLMFAMSNVVTPLPPHISEADWGSSIVSTLTGLALLVAPGSTWTPAAPAWAAPTWNAQFR